MFSIIKKKTHWFALIRPTALLKKTVQIIQMLTINTTTVCYCCPKKYVLSLFLYIRCKILPQLQHKLVIRISIISIFQICIKSPKIYLTHSIATLRCCRLCKLPFKSENSTTQKVNHTQLAGIYQPRKAIYTHKIPRRIRNDHLSFPLQSKPHFTFS